MTPEEESRVISAIASDIMNRLTIHGIIEASKHFSVEQARITYDNFSDEEKAEVLKEVDELEAKAQFDPSQATNSE